MSEKKKQVWIPPTTSKTIIFPLSEPTNTFETGSYDPSLINNQVSLEEINQFIPKINAEYELHKQNMKQASNKEGPFALLIIIFLCLDLYLFLYSNTDPQSIMSVSEAIILGTIVIFWICMFCGCKLNDIDFVSQMKDRCQDLIDQQNETLRDRGLKWHLPEQFPVWIELTKQMDKQNSLLEIAAQEVDIPRTTETTIILPHQHYKSEKKLNEVSRFTQDFYLPEMTNGRISSQEMQGFLAEINTCLRIPFEGSYTISHTLGFFFCLELFGLFHISNHSPDLLTDFQKGLIAFVSLLVCALVSDSEIRDEKGKKDIQMKIACQRIISRYNMHLQNYGLKWRLPDGMLDWIELCKDSSVSCENQAIYTRPGQDLEANNLSTPLMRE